ncbi:hypothetical protein M2360_002131 [Rhizobium sp. SG_E_25_P2]|uniref:hypothetical protein n=1 Tax=Rhizobium sp. SG_E_25_P2 TaxID=2879942 RepID=UPI002475F5E9|nr:hypothetical protein [Rhizobium sp. SG_E_25_P2]MDH6266735.1 hypothetical protein [Rhizobium sp. SG_E_25_P2]
MNRQRLLGLLLAGASFTALAHNAYALDGQEIVTNFNKLTSASGLTLSVDGSSVDGDTVTLTGATITISAAATQEPNDTILPLGDVTLEGVTEEEGDYSIEKASFADINLTEKDGGVTAKDIYAEGFYLPANPEPGSLDSLLIAQSFHIGAIAVTDKGKQVASIDEVTANYTLSDDETKIDLDASVTGIKVDASSAPDPKAQDTVKALGLETISGDITMKADWTLADGKMNLTEYAFDFENIGRLNITFSLSGYTLDFVKNLQEALKAAEENPNKEAGQQALGMSMLGLMQQLSYNGASIRFEDAGITAKALEYAGKQQGVDGAQFAQSLKGMAPMMLTQLNAPDLQAQISSAINAYLDNPKSLEISATPGQPLPVPQIMGAAMGNPADLAKTLNVQVKANAE